MKTNLIKKVRSDEKGGEKTQKSYSKFIQRNKQKKNNGEEHVKRLNDETEKNDKINTHK